MGPGIAAMDFGPQVIRLGEPVQTTVNPNTRACAYCLTKKLCYLRAVVNWGHIRISWKDNRCIATWDESNSYE